jgi:hypothetical protein
MLYHFPYKQARILHIKCAFKNLVFYCVKQYFLSLLVLSTLTSSACKWIQLFNLIREQRLIIHYTI